MQKITAAKKFTTSAQKTLLLPKDLILSKLEDEMLKYGDLKFEHTDNADIKAADLKDGSKLIIAAFDKGNGKTLAMIDHKDIPANSSRVIIQQALKEKLNGIFR